MSSFLNFGGYRGGGFQIGDINRLISSAGSLTRTVRRGSDDLSRAFGGPDAAHRDADQSGWEARTQRNYFTGSRYALQSGGLQAGVNRGDLPPPQYGPVHPPQPQYAVSGQGYPAPNAGYQPVSYGAPPEDPALAAWGQLSAGDRAQVISNMRDDRHKIYLSPSSDYRVTEAQLSAALHQYAGRVGMDPNHPDPREWQAMLHSAAEQGRAAGVGRRAADGPPYPTQTAPHPAPVSTVPLASPPAATPAPGTSGSGAGSATPGAGSDVPFQRLRPMRGQSGASHTAPTAIPVTEETRALQTAIVAYGKASGHDYTRVLATSAAPDGIDGQKGQKTEKALDHVRGRLGTLAQGMDDVKLTALLQQETTKLAGRAPHPEPTTPEERNAALRRGMDSATAARPPVAAEAREPAAITAAAVLAPFGAIASSLSEGASAIYSALPASVRDMARSAAGDIALSVRSVDSPSSPNGPKTGTQEAANTQAR